MAAKHCFHECEIFEFRLAVTVVGSIFGIAAHLIAEASDLLASSSDFDDLLDNVCEMVVPAFADSCHLYLVPTNEHGRRVAIAHLDPDIHDRLVEADRRWPLEPERPDSVAHMLLERTVFAPEIRLE